MLENRNGLTKECRMFIGQSVLAVVLLSLSVSAFSLFAHVAGLVVPNAVAGVFTVVVESAVALIWRRVAQGGSVDAVATFFSAVSGFRLLLALAVLAGCYIAVGHDAIANYLLVFMLFYFWIIVHHSVFFSRVSKSHTQCDNENNK